jgi:hypothetical protein
MIEKDAIITYLNAMGEEANKRYKENLKRYAMLAGYNILNADFLTAFKWRPVWTKLDNEYWLDCGNDEWNRVLRYFEYGTGLFGPKEDFIYAKNYRYMKFFWKRQQKWIYAEKTTGIRGGFMFTKAVESVRNEKELFLRDLNG